MDKKKQELKQRIKFLQKAISNFIKFEGMVIEERASLIKQRKEIEERIKNSFAFTHELSRERLNYFDELEECVEAYYQLESEGMICG